MRFASTCLLLLGALGCSTDLSADSFMDDDLPPWNCDTDATGPDCGESSGGTPAAECSGSVECGVGEFCTADFDGDIGTFRCEASCIAPMDDTRWCFDDSACCDTGAVCTRGYCIPPDDASSSGVDSTGTDTGDGSTGEPTGTDGSSSTGDAGASSSGGSSGG